jgi:hypothetical protein
MPPPPLIDPRPTAAQLPPAFLSTEPINGAFIWQRNEKWWSANRHAHPVNYPLWGFTLATPPFKDSPRAHPQHKTKCWPFSAFTLSERLEPCGGGVPVFSTYEMLEDGSARLESCFYHRASSNGKLCKHRGRIVPRMVGVVLYSTR